MGNALDGGLSRSFCLFILFYFIYLFIYFYFIYFIFREREKEGEREGVKYQCVVAFCTSPIGEPGPQPRHVP